MTSVKTAETIERLKEEIRNLEHELLNTREQFNAFMDNSPATAFYKDEQGRLLYINKSFNDAFSFHDKDWFGKTDHELWPEETANLLRANDLRVLESFQAETVYEDVVQSDGKHHWITFKFPFRDESGQMFLGGMGLDLTEQKKAEMELAKATEEAEKANLSKTKFIANISHEMRTPFNGILAAIELIRMHELDPEVASLVDVVSNCSESLLELIGDVLDLSKIESNQLHVDNKAGNLFDLCEEVANSYRFLAQQKELELYYVYELHTRFYSFDKKLLRQVLVNFVANALKFTNAGSVTLAVRHSELGGVEFCVKDTGVGIKDSMQGEVFNRFVQTEETYTKTYGGMGLGLHICQQLAKLMGGEITLESKVDVGSIFILRLPLACCDSEEIISESRQVIASGNGEKILLVEDNPVNQMVTRQLLEKIGYVVKVCSNGKEAVEILAVEKDFKLILMDIQMPVMNGLESSEKIRKGLSVETPIIALTANVVEAGDNPYKQFGINSVLHKPVRLESLSECLAQYLSQ